MASITTRFKVLSNYVVYSCVFRSLGSFPLELHQVHVHKVAPGINKIAVIGYLFVLGEDNPFLAQVQMYNAIVCCTG